MPALGAFGVTATGGWFAWAIRKVTRSKVNHAFIYVGHGFIVEAEPRGARVSLAKHYPNAVWSQPQGNVHTQLSVVEAALNLVGTPYNFLDIFAQLLVRTFHWKAPKWALQRISDPSTLQCAQLVDVAEDRGGVVLFKDGRPGGLVSPEDLRQLIEQDVQSPRV